MTREVVVGTCGGGVMMEQEEEEAEAEARRRRNNLRIMGGGGYRFVGIMTEKELVYRALLGDLLSPTQKAKLGAGDTAAAAEEV